jgi:hypothetical protein
MIFSKGFDYFEMLRYEKTNVTLGGKDREGGREGGDGEE